MDRYLKEFTAITRELLDSQQVRSMGLWRHHGPVTCLDHSLFVAYWTYRAARFLRLDIRAATRGALLHDLYLYDPRDKSAHPGNQCFDHPVFALRNAQALCGRLTEKEQNIIISHMWPLARRRPRCPEAAVVNLADKLCATAEAVGLRRFARQMAQRAWSVQTSPAAA